MPLPKIFSQAYSSRNIFVVGRFFIEAAHESQTLQDLWESLKAFLLALGDDVGTKELEQYVAFRRLKNFACVRLRSKDLPIGPNSIQPQ